MSGICGFKGLKDKELLAQMSETLRHRGPDQKGDYFDIENKIGLAHRRLSIVDLSLSAKQPLTNEDSSIYLICDGEIYNFKELRKDLKAKGHRFRSKTDSEVIIHAYEEYKEECLRYFNGMFAFCIWDKKRKEMFLARDRLGIKPLYYYLKNDIFLFSSELKALLNYKRITKELNYDALYLSLTLHYLPMEESVFKGIKHLLSGHYIKISPDTFEVKKYYQLQKKSLNLSLEETREKIFTILKSSVNLRLISDASVAIMLSGGLDSSTITALASAAHGKVTTYTVGFGDKNDEFAFAKEVAHRFNTDHHEIIIKPKDAIDEMEKIVYHNDEPLAETGVIPIYLIAKRLKESNIKVVLFGEGSDEIFGGYPWHKLGLWPLTMLPETVKRKLFFYMITYFQTDKKKFDIYNFLNERFNKEIDQNFSFLAKMLTYEIHNHLPFNHLHKVDRMTMAHSIEARAPFLDHRLVELVYSLPDKLKIGFFSEKYILRQAMKEILPAATMRRKKQAWKVPVSDWLINDFKEMSRDLLLSRDSISVRLLSKKQIEELYQPARGLENIKRKILLTRLFFLEMWYRVFKNIETGG